MTAQITTAVLVIPNYTRFQASMRLWGSPTMTAQERLRQEHGGIIDPRRVVAAGKL